MTGANPAWSNSKPCRQWIQALRVVMKGNKKKMNKIFIFNFYVLRNHHTRSWSVMKVFHLKTKRRPFLINKIFIFKKYMMTLIWLLRYFPFLSITHVAGATCVMNKKQKEGPF